MANDLDNLMPKIIARALMALREQVVMVRTANSDYESAAAEKGDTIDINTYADRTATDVTPSNTPPTPNSVTPSKVSITLDQWKKDNFHLTDKQMLEIDANANFIPQNMSQSIRAIAYAINAYMLGKYKGVYGYTGTAGTTPFASAVTGATNLRKVLNSQRCPVAPRYGVLDVDAEANALALAAFSDAEKTGSAQVKILGEIGMKFGFDWMWDTQVPTHTAGTLTGDPTVSGAHATGVSSVTLATDSNDAIALKEGDIIVFSGDSQTYAVGADLTVGYSSTGSLSISPTLQVAKTGGETITVKDSHVVNLGYHQEAFAFASRPLAQSSSDRQLGGRIMEMTDPFSGLSLRLEVSRQYKQVVWEFDILYGGNLVRPELAARLAG